MLPRPLNTSRIKSVQAIDSRRREEGRRSEMAQVKRYLLYFFCSVPLLGKCLPPILLLHMNLCVLVQVQILPHCLRTPVLSKFGPHTKISPKIRLPYLTQYHKGANRIDCKHSIVRKRSVA